MKMFAMPNGRLPEDQKALDENGLLRRNFCLVAEESQGL